MLEVNPLLIWGVLHILLPTDGALDEEEGQKMPFPYSRLRVTVCFLMMYLKNQMNILMLLLTIRVKDYIYFNSLEETGGMYITILYCDSNHIKHLPVPMTGYLISPGQYI